MPLVGPRMHRQPLRTGLERDPPEPGHARPWQVAAVFLRKSAMALRLTESLAVIPASFCAGTGLALRSSAGHAERTGFSRVHDRV